MKFGNASWGFRETPLEKQLEITKNMGLCALELGIANAPADLPLNADSSVLRGVVELYNKYGIDLACAATGNDFTTGSKDDIAKIKRVTDMCAEMGVKYLRIFAGFSPVDEVVGERWKIMLECLNECADYAEAKNVTLTVETHGGVSATPDNGVRHFYSTSSKPDILQKMLDALPQSVKICFDPANLYAVGIDKPETLYRQICGRVATMHLKDFVTLPSGSLKPASCGESNMDWSSLLAAVKGFDGYALFEYENVDDIYEGSVRCCDFIKKEIEK